MTYSLDLDEDVGDYEPQPPFDIDIRPVAPGELKAWRHGLWRETRQTDLADQIGFSLTKVSDWERQGVEYAPQCAIVRQFFAGEPVPITKERAPHWQAKSLAALVGGWHHLEDVLRIPASRMASGWLQCGVPVRRGTSDLIRWLYDEMDPPRVDSMVSGRESALNDDEIREVIDRREAGETYSSIAEDYPLTVSGIHAAYRRHTQEVRP